MNVLRKYENILEEESSFENSDVCITLLVYEMKSHFRVRDLVNFNRPSFCSLFKLHHFLCLTKESSENTQTSRKANYHVYNHLYLHNNDYFSRSHRRTVG